MRMDTANTTDFQKLLFEAWIDYQKAAGTPVTQKDFAEFLGINNTLLSHYFKGKRTPKNMKIIQKLEEKLGQEIYPVLGLASPDPMLRSIEKRWHLISPDVKKQINRIILDHIGEEISKDESV